MLDYQTISLEKATMNIVYEIYKSGNKEPGRLEPV